MVKHIRVTKEMQDKMAEEYNKRLEEKENETKDKRDIIRN